MIHDYAVDDGAGRLPLLTRDEAVELIALLGALADGAEEPLRRAAAEQQHRIGTRLPAA